MGHAAEKLCLLSLYRVGFLRPDPRRLLIFLRAAACTPERNVSGRLVANTRAPLGAVVGEIAKSCDMRAEVIG